MDEKEIKDFIKAIEIHHNEKILQQKADQTFYDDIFKVSIAEPFHVVRTGSGARVVANIVSHLETANPLVKREPHNKSDKARESAQKVERFLNYLIKKFKQEINETAWNAVLRGEGIYQVEWNSEAYERKGKDYVHRIGDLPIIITSLDPMNVFCTPYDALLPREVAKIYTIDRFTAIQNYPEVYINKVDQNFKYSAYYNDDTKCFLVESALVKGGIQKNIYGFPPFIHFHSGYGKRSPEGRPETMAVGALRRLRGLLKEECESTSRFDSIIALYANPIGVIEQVEQTADPIDREELENTVLGPGAVVSPGFGYKFTIYVPNVQVQQLAVHIAQVRSALGLEDPPIMSGMPSSGRTTGRMEDIEFQHVFKRNAKLIKNHEEALSLVLGRCLQILYEQPQALPVSFRSEIIEKGESVLKEDKITKDDINGYYDCEVELNPDEDVEANANFMKFRMLVNENRISWKRFLIDGLKKTEYEADEIIAEAIAEMAILNNPEVRAGVDAEAVEQMGLTNRLNKLREEAALQGEMGKALQGRKPGYRPTEANNPTASGIVRQVLESTPNSQRRSPGV